MKFIEIIPTEEKKFREFPEIQYGLSKVQSGEDKTEVLYFNATHYIREKSDVKKHNIEEFRIGFHFWITAISQAYEVPPEDLIVRDSRSNEIFMDESLCLLFIAYVDASFAIHVLDRMEEMLINGIVLSDTFLMAITKSRFPDQE